MVRGALGKVYKDGDVIIQQGKTGDSMYVVQGGRVEVIQQSEDGAEQHLAFLEAGDFFGEMAVFEKEVRSATVRVSRKSESSEDRQKGAAHENPRGSLAGGEPAENDVASHPLSQC